MAMKKFISSVTEYAYGNHKEIRLPIRFESNQEVNEERISIGMGISYFINGGRELNIFGE